MKFLVLGCTGMAGHMVSLYLHEQNHEVLGFARRKFNYVPSISGDAQNTAFLKSLIKDGNFDSVVNCVGVLNRSAEEDRERAVFLNSYLPHFLARTAEETPTQVIHLSTDCVFSGDRGGYTEEDFPDGRTFYDRTKALGELDDGKNVSLRNSIVGPDLDPGGIGLLNWFLQQHGEIDGYTKSLWTGLTTLQLAKTVEAAARVRAHGLFHVVPEGTITKFELLELFNRHLRREPVKINPRDGVNSDKSLKRTRFDFDFPIPDYEAMVCELAEWIKAHKEMYPHYLP